MLSFPFEIPPSLYRYLEKFDEAPSKTTEKLESHLQRRGQDPIGEFLLAWFYLKQDKFKKASKCAIKAKAMAPGSPLMEFLPYFIQHPKTFTAWQPSRSSHNEQVTELLFAHPSYPNNTDLDHLIEQISKVDPKDIRSMADEKNQTGGEDSEIEAEIDDVDDIVSETIAEIYEKQNRLGKAKKVYEKLIDYYPDKEDEYKGAIKRLNQRMEEQENENN